jgi:ribonuclease HI
MGKRVSMHSTAKRSLVGKPAKIYCDALFQSGRAGVGVYCERPAISIRKTFEELHSANAAECVAAIEAIRAAEELLLEGFQLWSGSRLVVEWTSGGFEMKCVTAFRYVPEIRDLLRAKCASIHWTGAGANPAEQLSRSAIEGRSDFSDGLLYVISAPMDGLRSKDFAKLRCSADGLSRKRLPDLLVLAGDAVSEQVRSAFEQDKHVAACLRWVLRGLPVDKAIRKVETDLDIGEHVRSLRRPGWADFPVASRSGRHEVSKSTGRL